MTGHRAVFAAACLGMLLFGVTLTTLGAVLPPLIARYGLRESRRGLAPGPDEPGDPGGVAGLRAGGGPIRVPARAHRRGDGRGAGPGGHRVGAVADPADAGDAGVRLRRRPAQRCDERAGRRHHAGGAGVGAGAAGRVLRDRSVRRPARARAPAAMGDLHDDRGRVGAAGRRAAGWTSWWCGSRRRSRRRGSRCGASGRCWATPRCCSWASCCSSRAGWRSRSADGAPQYVREVLGLSAGAVDPGAVTVLGRDGGRPARADPVAADPARRRPCSRGSWRWPWRERGCCWPCGARRAAGDGLFLLGDGLAAGFPILLGFLGGLYRDLTGTAFSAVFVMALIGGSCAALPDGRAGRPSRPAGLPRGGAHRVARARDALLLLRRRLGAIDHRSRSLPDLRNRPCWRWNG